jgi:methionyl-tRNA synthetase
MPNKTYLTTTLPYVNADPHIGFALELVQADILARYRALLGEEILLNTGTDEHGLKIQRKAQEEGKEAQAYVDEYAAKFKLLPATLGLTGNLNFIRTTDKHHLAAAQDFWRRCAAAGDIYKKEYKVKYCVGCELEKTDSELVEGKCPIHPNLELELIEEENYFFKFSKYQKPLLELYEKNPNFVIPATRQNEIRAFVERGLEDFSISRLAKKMPWGVPVPDDADHVMYVWFDALVNYVSAIGWPMDMAKFESWWPVTQFAGKDNLRQQAAMWQAMLMSAGLPSSKQIIIHGFIQSGGQKMSKSLGNVINPLDLVKEYGTDAVRYFLARHVSTFEDSDVTLEKFKEAYNAGLANGLGNLVSRVMKMAVDNLEGSVELTEETRPDSRVAGFLDSFEISRAIDAIWERIGQDDALIAVKKPFSGVKSDDANVREEALLVIKKLVRELNAIATDLEPFLPATSAIIKQLVKENKMPEKPLFVRK